MHIEITDPERSDWVMRVRRDSDGSIEIEDDAAGYEYTQRIGLSPEIAVDLIHALVDMRHSK
jgi:hypothetical protein